MSDATASKAQSRQAKAVPEGTGGTDESGGAAAARQQQAAARLVEHVAEVVGRADELSDDQKSRLFQLLHVAAR